MVAQYTDREFVNFFYGSLRFGSAEANAKAVFSLMSEAALDSDSDRSDRAAFATIVQMAEPLGTAARSIRHKSFSLSPTMFFIRELTDVCGCEGFARMRAESQLASKDEP